MEALDFVLLKQREADLCRARVAYRLEAWEKAWTQGAKGGRVSCRETSQSLASAEGRWAAFTSRTGRRDVVWYHVPPTLNAVVQELIFATDNNAGQGESSLAADVVKAAVNDLLAELAGELLGAEVTLYSGDASPPDSWFLRYTGIAAITVAFGVATVHLLYQPPRSRPHAPTADTPLASLADALTKTPVTLFAELGAVDIPIGQFLSIAPGDVLRLPVALDQLIEVRTGDGRTVCAAHLGVQDGQRALEMAPTD